MYYYYHLGEPVDHYHDGIVASAPRQVDDKVDVDGFESFRDSLAVDATEFAHHASVVQLVYRALWAVPDLFGDCGCQAGSIEHVNHSGVSF
jgi:hypothetical protein